jgi:hypothetical protein
VYRRFEAQVRQHAEMVYATNESQAKVAAQQVQIENALSGWEEQLSRLVDSSTTAQELLADVDGLAEPERARQFVEELAGAREDFATNGEGYQPEVAALTSEVDKVWRQAAEQAKRGAAALAAKTGDRGRAALLSACRLRRAAEELAWLPERLSEFFTRAKEVDARPPAALIGRLKGLQALGVGLIRLQQQYLGMLVAGAGGPELARLAGEIAGQRAKFAEEDRRIEALLNGEPEDNVVDPPGRPGARR